MKKILIIGKKSFIAKNFIADFNNRFELFYFDKYFKKNDLSFNKILNNFIKKNKINLILNFAGDNNNSLKGGNFDKILESNFYLPLSLLSIANRFKIPLFLFLSKDMNDNKRIKNFYSLSKQMLKIYINNSSLNCKLRILTIDSIYGPFDLNKKRIFPSIFNNLYNKSKVSINLNQLKYFTFVKDLNKILFNLIYSQKDIIYKNVKSDKINVKFIFNLIKKDKIIKLNNQNSKYRALLLTSEWYKKYYGKI